MVGSGVGRVDGGVWGGDLLCVCVWVGPCLSLPPPLYTAAHSMSKPEPYSSPHLTLFTVPPLEPYSPSPHLNLIHRPPT